MHTTQALNSLLHALVLFTPPPPTLPLLQSRPNLGVSLSAAVLAALETSASRVGCRPGAFSQARPTDAALVASRSLNSLFSLLGPEGLVRAAAAADPATSSWWDRAYQSFTPRLMTQMGPRRLSGLLFLLAKMVDIGSASS